MSTLEHIGLVIQEPTHQQTFVGVGTETSVDVTLRGTITATTFPIPAALFRAWYSSLQGDVGHTDTVTVGLSVGSHILTFTAKDKSDMGVPPDQLANLYKSVQHIGAAGGPPNPSPANGAPCVIHVLIANMLAPGVGVTTLSRSNPVLEAQAPLQWATYDQYVEPEPNYHAVNKVRYRWFLQRVSPVGPVMELDVQGGNSLRLIAPSNAVAPPPRLRYIGALPAALVTGVAYNLTLRVEHRDNNALGHQVTRVVTIVA
jgi:hypothetical protein